MSASGIPPYPAATEATPLLWPPQTGFPSTGGHPSAGMFSSGAAMNPHMFQYFQQTAGQSGGQAQTKKICFDGDLGKDPHSQFCALTGCPPTDVPSGTKFKPNEKSLYGRVVYLAQEQQLNYQLAAATTNILLLLQIVLGAVLTGLGGSTIPRYWITLIGATNTIIAGLVAYLKSRGQPMRARMFRDDLERVIGEIENSEVMWLGISKDVHGYDDIDTGEVTVRSEVARLTRLLDKAIRANTANNPDLYSMPTDSSSSKQTTAQSNVNFVPVAVDPSATGTAPSAPMVKDADAAPAASASGKKKAEEEKKRKEEEDKKRKEEEEKKKSAEPGKSGDASKSMFQMSSTTDDKGKGTNTISTSSTSKQEFSSSSVGDTKTVDSKGDVSESTPKKDTGS